MTRQPRAPYVLLLIVSLLCSWSVPNTSSAFYNQGNGRFLTLDPHPGDPQQPQTLHKYTYAEDDPVNKSDPSGLCTATMGEVQTVSAIQFSITQQIAGNVLLAMAADDLDQAIKDLHGRRAIEQFVQVHQAIAPTQQAVEVLEAQINAQRRWRPKPLYLHYSYDYQADSLRGGLWPGSYATRTLYPTGWQAKWYLALPQSEVQNSLYLVWPGFGFGPTAGPMPVPQHIDRAGRNLPGGGQQWIFGHGSGGFGTVHGPIPLPIGQPPVAGW